MSIPKSASAERAAEVDPVAAKVARGAARLKPMSECSAAEARQIREDIGNPFAPPAIASVSSTDMYIEVEGRKLLIRQYRDAALADAAAKSTLPALLYFHGGGFVLSNVEQYDTVMQQLAHHSGCVVFSVDYELAPERKLKDIYRDGQACYQWLRAQAPALGIDVSRIAMGGDSAGGNLSIAIILDCLQRELPPPAFALLIYPAVDPDMSFPSVTEFAEDYFLTRENMEWFRGQYLAAPTETADPELRLLERACRGFPTSYVLTAGFDPLRDEGKAFAERLAANGTAVEHECYTDMIHGFISFAGGLAAGGEALEQMGQRVARALAS